MAVIILVGWHENLLAKEFSYLGLDYSYTSTKFQQTYGRNIFSSKQIPQYNIFLGYYFFPLLGFEFGVAQTNTYRGTVFVPAMTDAFGVNVFTAIASNMYGTSQKLNELNLNYVPSVKLFSRINIIPVLGFAYIRTKANLALTEFDGASATNSQKTNYALQFAGSRYVPRLGVRLQFMLYNIGLRFSYIWEQTTAIQMQATRGIRPNQILTAKMQNSSVLGVGILYKFGR